MTQAEAVSETTLRICRTLVAPRELVFKAWTEPDNLKKWWCVGADYSTPIAEVDLRVGGKYRLGMQAPDNDQPFVAGGTYQARIPHLAKTSDEVSRQLSSFCGRFMNHLAVFEIKYMQ